jgi:four helix bundle protein
MMQQLSHKTLDLYTLSKKLVQCCYELTEALPKQEGSNLPSYIRNSAIIVHVNVAQGAFLKARKKRKKFVKSAQNALVVIDAVIEVLIELKYISQEKSDELVKVSSQCYQMLQLLLKK